MDSAAIAKHVVSSMANKDRGGDKSDAPPKGIGTGHVAASERMMDALSERKPTEFAAALKDFIGLCQAEGYDD